MRCWCCCGSAGEGADGLRVRCCRSIPGDLEKYTFLAALKERNENVFYSLVGSNMKECTVRSSCSPPSSSSLTRPPPAVNLHSRDRFVASLHVPDNLSTHASLSTQVSPAKSSPSSTLPLPRTRSSRPRCTSPPPTSPISPPSSRTSRRASPRRRWRFASSRMEVVCSVWEISESEEWGLAWASSVCTSRREESTPRL